MNLKLEDFKSFLKDFFKALTEIFIKDKNTITIDKKDIGVDVDIDDIIKKRNDIIGRTKD